MLVGLAVAFGMYLLLLLIVVTLVTPYPPKVAVPVFVLLGLFGVLVLVAALWSILRIARLSATLYGSEVLWRGALTTRRVDLATAQKVRTSDQAGTTPSGRIPILEVMSDAHGRSLTLRFASAARGYLPRYEVDALAAAVRSGRRDPLSSAQAEQAVQQLYARAY